MLSLWDIHIGEIIAAIPTYIINEGCEGAGTPAGWTEYKVGTGSYNWDYATSPAPLAGAQSLRMIAGSAAGDWEVWYYTFTEMTSFHLYFMFNVTTKPGSTKIDLMHFDDDASHQFGAISWGVNNFLEVYDEDIGGSETTYALSTGTTYHIWVDRIANGVMSVYINTSATKPGTPEWTYGSVYNDGVGMIALIADPGVTEIFDNIKVDNVTIGSNPS